MDLLDLSYDDFDQSNDTGWRPIARGGDCARAAALIETYLDKHSDLADWQVQVLHFHAVQMHAFADNYAAALAHIPCTRESGEIVDPLHCWNDYVDATEAFLCRDLPALNAAVDRMKNDTASIGSIPNLRVAERLLANFGQPYSTVF